MRENTYRQDLQAVRAIAVIAVILFHLPLDFAEAGFVGVDIFFVISGYVITSSTVQIKTVSTFSFLATFFRKRLSRILPALVICVMLVLVCVSLLLPPDVSKVHIIKTGILSIFGASNVFLLSINNEYWREATVENPFVHTWSLGVEFQFYVVFPFLFLLLNRLKGHSLIRSFLVILVVCGGAGAFYIFMSAPSLEGEVFFLPQYRVWEFLLGVGACLLTREETLLNRITCHLHSIRHLVEYSFLIAISALVFAGDKIMEREYLVALSCLLTFLFIVLNTHRTETTSGPFNTWWVQRIGDASYSLYLYHWPVFTIFAWVKNFSGIWDYFVAILIMLTLSIGSHYFVERRWRAIKIRYVAITALVPLLLALNEVAYSRNLVSTYPVIKKLYYSSVWEIPEFAIHSQWMRMLNNVDSNDDRYTIKQKARVQYPTFDESFGAYVSKVAFSLGDPEGLIIVVGDSLAVSSSPMLLKYAAANKFDVALIYLTACRENLADCLSGYVAVSNLVERNKDVLRFIFFATLERKDRPYYTDGFPILAKTANAANLPIIVQGPIPEVSEQYTPKTCLSTFKKNAIECGGLAGESVQNLQRQYKEKESYVSAFEAMPGVSVWRPWDVFCNDVKCREIVTEGWTLRDNAHLSVAGSVSLLNHFETYLKHSALLRAAQD